MSRTSRRRSRGHRWVRCGAVVLLASLGAAACGGSSDDATGRGSTDPGTDTATCATDLADGPTEITVWHPYNTLTKATLGSIAEAYNASQSRVHVNVEAQGNTIELQKKFDEMMASLGKLADEDATLLLLAADA